MVNNINKSNNNKSIAINMRQQLPPQDALDLSGWGEQEKETQFQSRLLERPPAPHFCLELLTDRSGSEIRRPKRMVKGSDDKQKHEHHYDHPNKIMSYHEDACPELQNLG